MATDEVLAAVAPLPPPPVIVKMGKTPAVVE